MSDLDKLRALSAQATDGTWYTVDAPWRYSDVATYAVARDPDPHAGIAVLDSVQEFDDDDSPELARAQADVDLEFAVACVNYVRALLGGGS